MPGARRSRGKPVRIEVLYVPGCPNYELTVRRIEEVLAAEMSSAPICGVPVTTDAEARSREFPGSPTVRVNGKDIEPSGNYSFGLACRIYPNGSGIPPEETVRAAISEAKQTE
jgi:hypothetical protein